MKSKRTNVTCGPSAFCTVKKRGVASCVRVLVHKGLHHLLVSCDQTGQPHAPHPHCTLGNTSNALCCDASFERPVGVDIRDDNRSFHGVCSAVCFRLWLATHRVRDVPFEPVSQCDKKTVLPLLRYGWDKRPCSVTARCCCQMLRDGHIVNQIVVLPSLFLFCPSRMRRPASPLPLAGGIAAFHWGCSNAEKGLSEKGEKVRGGG